MKTAQGLNRNPHEWKKARQTVRIQHMDDRKPKPSFADIYSQWENTHDEDAAMRKKAASHQSAKEAGPTINQVRHMAVQDELDLHEMIRSDALQATTSFLDSSYDKGLKKVRIITGKGLHSKGGEAVLRPAVIEVCRNHPGVREVSVPKAAEGGSGALTVIFKTDKGRANG